MHIVVLQDDFPPKSSGGASQVAANFAHAFVQEGHQVSVVTTAQTKEDAVLGESRNGMTVYRIHVPHYNERWRAYRSLYNPTAVKQVRQILRDLQPDAVSAHNIHYYLSYASLKAARQVSSKVILTAHDVMSFHYGKMTEFISSDTQCPQEPEYRVSTAQRIRKAKKRYNPVRNVVIRYYLGYVDSVVAVSYALRDALEQNGIANVRVIHNGIDVDEWMVSQHVVDAFKQQFGLEGKQPVFFGGRFSTLKGSRKIIDAMERVIRDVPDAVLLVAGRENSHIKAMQDVARGKGVPMVCVGWLNGDTLKAAYWASDIVAVPSICFDSFPTNNLEAMACQTPVIATCFGGSHELVADGQTGYILNPYNVDELAQRITTLLTNGKIRQQFGTQGFQRVATSFRLQDKAKEYLSLLS